MKKHLTKVKKITQDGFAWYILSANDAINAFRSGVTIFALYDDDTESQIVTTDDLDSALQSDDIQIGIEMGFIKTRKI
jgi:hypothetical protein